MNTCSHPFAHTRAAFPILASKAQLSSCSQSAMSSPVAAALQEYVGLWRDEGMAWGPWMGAVEAAKGEFARLIGARPEDVAVCASVSDAASSIASALDFAGGRRGIVVGANEFPSVGHVWLAQERRGAKVTFAQADEQGWISQDSYEAAIRRAGECALVSVSHAAFYNGALQDIAGITRIARVHGAITFIDAYQSAGALCLDVERDGIDMLASGVQKFLLGCPGIAFLYVRPGLAQQLTPSNTGWFGRVNPFAFDIQALDFPPNAGRFNTGTPPMINAYAAAAALRFMARLDRVAVEDYLRHLSGIAVAEAQRLGFAVASPLDPARRAVTTAIRVRDAAAIERQMASAGYIVSARNDVIRIAPHFYNTEAEVVGALRTLARMLPAA
jgi:selenocysteine lyase/cysteine desulfurase